ncbi:hypothetical protein HP425_28080, partial [Brevibacillus sp. HD1.4A]|nr:hypothetical protein [Brevibacillus sp. HD1.4A]
MAHKRTHYNGDATGTKTAGPGIVERTLPDSSYTPYGDIAYQEQKGKNGGTR